LTLRQIDSVGDVGDLCFLRKAPRDFMNHLLHLPNCALRLVRGRCHRIGLRQGSPTFRREAAESNVDLREVLLGPRRIPVVLLLDQAGQPTTILRRCSPGGQHFATQQCIEQLLVACPAIKLESGRQSAMIVPSPTTSVT
jgi:hypothetical protein